MAVRAKFQVYNVTDSITKDGTVGSRRVEMSAVYGQNGSENAAWSKATPVGRLEMTITNMEAAGQFLPGQSWYLDLTLAEEAPTS